MVFANWLSHMKSIGVFLLEENKESVFIKKGSERLTYISEFIFIGSDRDDNDEVLKDQTVWND